jgi:hypothetical protein
LLLFGGPEDQRSNVPTKPGWQITLICPKTDESFLQTVPVSAKKHEDIFEVRQSQAQTSTPPEDTIATSQRFGVEAAHGEAQEWIKASPTVARDFCKTMLGVSLSASPVFFAVLKFLGVEKPTTWVPGWLGIFPPLIFLCSAAVFIWILRPWYFEMATIEEFEEFRTRRVVRMNQLIILASGLFLAGLALAIGLCIFLVTP